MNLSHLDSKYRLLWRRGNRSSWSQAHIQKLEKNHSPGIQSLWCPSPQRTWAGLRLALTHRRLDLFQVETLRMCSNAYSCVLGEFRRTSEEMEAFWRGIKNDATERNHVKKCQRCQIHKEWGQREKKPCWTPECSSGDKDHSSCLQPYYAERA